MTTPDAGREPVIVPAGGGELLDLGRSAPRILLSGATSQGRLSVLETTQSPGGGPPLHVHGREDESFYVLDGRFTFTCGDESWDGEPGSFASLPAGRPHRYQAGEAGGRLLMLFSPSGMEDYFREWAALVASGAMTDPAMAELAEHHGMRLLGNYPAAAPPGS
ncbi:MAG: hypothetical protein QOJ90_1740 [Actinomycetota bacterium]|nr:hypothetical protein [Actinomycetota bacterium]MDQ1642389.1 hypothetical protein [Actinomycetota bacterium]